RGAARGGARRPRAAFVAACKTRNNGRHWVAGDRGVSECTFTGTAADGSRVEADMVDVFTFQDGKIRVKNAFRKQRPALPARA
ncbi:MAG: nuclear transport factor 2 family protein, partial [Achromobacter sp.]|nr:nuclear transport factor 2 family protein [Achromobacter sp.]